MPSSTASPVSVPSGERASARPLPGALAGWRWLVVIAVFALAIGFQGARGLYDPDEGRYAAVALQMLRSGDWFTPQLNHELPHFSKPPLTYWVLAASMKLLGESERALRLPMALGYAATVLLTWGIARRLSPDDPVLPPLVQATSLFPVVAANLVTSDPLLLLWETLAVYAFVVLWWDRSRAPAPRWAPILLWAALGLAFLTKGPPGLLPLAAIVAFAAWSEGTAGLRRLVTPLGFLLFALLGFGWFGLQALARPDLLPYLLGGEVVGRVSGDYLRNPGWSGLVRTYLPILVLGLFPWVLVAWRRPSATVEDRVPQAPGAVHFLLLWLLLPLAVFFASQSRLPLYLLPLTVPAALLLGRRLAGRRPRWAAPALGLWVMALLALEAFAAVHSHPRNGRELARELESLLDERPSEVVFVDEKPRWTLELYLRSEVESVQVVEDLRGREGPAYRPLSETLSHELGECEEGAVYLVPGGSLAPWRQTLERQGWKAHSLGRVREFEVFAAEPPPGGAAAHS